MLVEECASRAPNFSPKTLPLTLLRTQNLRIFRPNPPSASSSGEFLAFRSLSHPCVVDSNGGISASWVLCAKSSHNPNSTWVDFISVSPCKGKFPRKRVRKKKDLGMVCPIGRCSSGEAIDWKGFDSKRTLSTNMGEKSLFWGRRGRFVCPWWLSAWWRCLRRGGGGRPCWQWMGSALKVCAWVKRSQVSRPLWHFVWRVSLLLLSPRYRGKPQCEYIISQKISEFIKCLTAFMKLIVMMFFLAQLLLIARLFTIYWCLKNPVIEVSSSPVTPRFSGLKQSVGLGACFAPCSSFNEEVSLITYVTKFVSIASAVLPICLICCCLFARTHRIPYVVLQGSIMFSFMSLVFYNSRMVGFWPNYDLGLMSISFVKLLGKIHYGVLNSLVQTSPASIPWFCIIDSCEWIALPLLKGMGKKIKKIEFVYLFTKYSWFSLFPKQHKGIHIQLMYFCEKMVGWNVCRKGEKITMTVSCALIRRYFLVHKFSYSHDGSTFARFRLWKSSPPGLRLSMSFSLKIGTSYVSFAFETNRTNTEASSSVAHIPFGGNKQPFGGSKQPQDSRLEITRVLDFSALKDIEQHVTRDSVTIPCNFGEADYIFDHDVEQVNHKVANLSLPTRLSLLSFPGLLSFLPTLPTFVSLISIKYIWLLPSRWGSTTIFELLSYAAAPESRLS